MKESAACGAAVNAQANISQSASTCHTVEAGSVKKGEGETMVVERINPRGLHDPVNNLYAHIVRTTGDVTYRIGGQVPVGADGANLFVGDMAAQIRSCYGQVTLALESVGLGWSNVTHIYTFTTDMDAYLEAEPPIVKSYFGEEPPASTLVEVSRLVERDWLVEVQVDATADA